MKQNIALRNGLLTFLIFLSFAIQSCKKESEWLDAKANKSDVVPKSLKDLQGILDNDVIFNLTPGLGNLGIDNYDISYSDWQTADPIQRNAYTWAPDIFQSSSVIDWNLCYQKIELANIVLEQLMKITVNTSNQADYDQIKGSALFFRAKSFFDLTSLFGKPFDLTSYERDLGIPIRTTTDVNVKSTRATVKETFDQIIKDLKEADALLPLIALHQLRPSKPAAEGLLAKTYLNIADYAKAGNYSDIALTNYNSLLDFNTLPDQSYPFADYPDNKEIIFWSQAIGYSLISPANSVDRVDSNLFLSYDTNDVRRSAFYSDISGQIVFDGPYTGGTGYLFSGLATNELYLIHAECLARQGNTNAAMDALNALLSKRWKDGTFVPITAFSPDDALKKILVERNKELPFTSNIRWDDLRRLNKESQFAKTLTRNLNGSVFTLEPNDNKYVYPIPPDEIKLSGIEQNPR
ncbi:MAG: RagB/SusD family nutrient uptake outer membrane protein [Chitinophagaceae bacterium]